MMKKTKKIFANTFIVIVLMMMIRPHLPMKTKFFSMIYQPILKIERSIGTNQTWTMFSPNPSKLDAYVVGVVDYQDGSRDSYDFNKKFELNIIQKYLYGEKYRKFTSEHLRADKKSFLWSDGADFAVKKLSEKNPGKIPRKVTLTRYWSKTPDWNKYFIKHGEPKSKYSSFVFYRKGL